MKPLSKKQRIISFILMIFIFLIVCPLILAYSLGYRFDDTFSWIETGGIYLHANISNTEIYLAGKFIENNGVLLRNTLIQNLRSDTSYKMEVHKEGYHSWIKMLYVQPSLVTEGSLMMMPKDIEKKGIYPYQDEFGEGTTTIPVGPLNKEEISKNGDYEELEILFGLVEAATSTDLSNEKDSEDDFLSASTSSSTIEEDKTPEHFIELGIEDPTLLRNLIETSNEVMWLEDPGIVIYWIGKKESAPYYYCLLKKCRNKINLNWDIGIKRFSLFPGRSDVWIVLDDNGLWAVEIDDRSERNIQPIYLGADLDFRVNDKSNIVVLDNDIFYELSL